MVTFFYFFKVTDLISFISVLPNSSSPHLSSQLSLHPNRKRSSHHIDTSLPSKRTCDLSKHALSFTLTILFPQTYISANLSLIFFLLQPKLQRFHPLHNARYPVHPPSSFLLNNLNSMLDTLP